MIDPQIIHCIESIQILAEENKTEIYIVGGFLRDLLLTRKTSDIDFAVAHHPKVIAEKFSDRFKFPMVVLEEEQEIYRVIAPPDGEFAPDGFTFDFAKFKDQTIAEDLAKRDFTINALASRLKPAISNLRSQISNSEALLDPFNAREDLKNKIVRQISPRIYDDDPLRMLRAFRCASQLGFAVEPATLQAIQSNAKKIHSVAAERIREEILLLLDPSDSYPYFCQLDESGLVSELFSEVDPNRNCADQYYPGKGVWGHSLDSFKCLEWIFRNLGSEFPEDCEKMSSFLFQKGDESEGHPRATLMKLAVLFHDIGKAPTAKIIENRMRFFDHQMAGGRIIEQIARRLKFSTSATRSLSLWVESHMRPGGLTFVEQLTDRARFRFFRDLGNASIPVLLISLADRYTYIPDDLGKKNDPHETVTKELVRWHYQKEMEELSKKPKLINGNVLMEKLNLAPGPLIGEILKAVEEAAVLEEIKTPEEAVEFSKRFLQNHPEYISKSS